MSERDDPVARNRSAILADILAGRVAVATHPFEIQFSAEHRCNLRCVQCNATIERHHGAVPLMDRKLPARALERFTKLLPMVPSWQWLSLTGSGEPLLSPELPAILALMRGRPCHVMFNTNGTMMTRRNAAMIVENQVAEIHFSIDGVGETFERVRVRAKWGQVVQGIRTLQAAKREHGSARPKIAFSSNFMRQNIDDLPRVVEAAGEMGVPVVIAHNTLMFDPAMAGEALVHHRPRTRTAAIEATCRARALGVELMNNVYELDESERQEVLARVPVAGTLRAAAPDVNAGDPQQPAPAAVPTEAPKPVAAIPRCDASAPARATITAATPPAAVAVQPRPADDASGDGGSASLAMIPTLPGLPGNLPAIVRACQRPWTGLYVENEGSVRVCCYNSPLVGNLDEESIEEIWNGVRLRDLRRAFLAGEPPQGCRDCYIFAKYEPREEVFVRSPASSKSNLEVPGATSVPAGDLTILGWAVDLHGVAAVELLLDGRHLGYATHGQPRPDVAAVHSSHPGAHESGFRYLCAGGALSPGDHRLLVRIHSRAGHVEDGAYQPFCVVPGP